MKEDINPKLKIAWVIIILGLIAFIIMLMVGGVSDYRHDNKMQADLVQISDENYTWYVDGKEIKPVGADAVPEFVEQYNIILDKQSKQVLATKPQRRGFLYLPMFLR